MEKSEFPDRIHDTLMRRIAKAVLGFLKGYRDTAAMEEETTGDRNAVEPLSLVAVDTEAGKITEVQSERNQYGRWDRRKVERTAKNQTSTDTQDGHLSSTEIVKNTQAAAPAEREAATGERVSVQNQETEFGKHSTAVLVETAVELTTTDRERGHQSDTDTVKKWNAEKVEAAPVATSGNVKSLVQTPTPYKDKWNVVESTESSKPFDSGWKTYYTRNGEGKYRVWRNQDIGFADTVAAVWGEDTDTNNTLRFSPTKFGKWDGYAIESPASNQTPGTFWKSIRKESTTIKPEERRIVEISPGAGQYYVTQTRTREYTKWYSINQGADGAYNDQKAMNEGLNATQVFLTTPSVSRVSDEKGRVGFRAQCEYITYGAWE